MNIVSLENLSNAGVDIAITSNSNPLWRISLHNSAWGRDYIKRILDEPYISEVMAIWGDSPAVEEPEYDDESQIDPEQVSDGETLSILLGEL